MSGDWGLSLFALEGSRDFGERVAARLDVPLAEHEEREFEDGEHKTRPLVKCAAGRLRPPFALRRAGQSAMTSSAGCCSSSAR